MEFDDDFVVKDKYVKVYKNGDPVAKPIEIKIQKGLTLSKLATTLEQKSDMKNLRQIRLFNQEGVELFNDDLAYLKDKSIVYVSKDTNTILINWILIIKHIHINYILLQLLLKVKILMQTQVFQNIILLRFQEKVDLVKFFQDNIKQLRKKSQLKLQKQMSQFKKKSETIKQLFKQFHYLKFSYKNKYQMFIKGNASDIDMVFREAEILKSLNHKNIVRIKNCYTLSDMKVVFIMEFLEGGELLDRVEKENNFSEQQSKIYFKQIVEAMSYCHKNKLIHRDLKLENLLLVSEQSDQIKVVDFGIAGVASKQSVENIDAGSLRYMAPEVLNGKTKQITPAIDVWAMGVILYMMIVGEFPFNGPNNNSIMEKITEGSFEIPKDIKKKLSKECIDVMEKTLTVDPNHRINTVDLMNHPFICEENITIKFIEEENKSQVGSDTASKLNSKLNTPMEKLEKQILTKGNSLNVVGRSSVSSGVSIGSGSTKSSSSKKSTTTTTASVNPKGSFTPQPGQVKKPSEQKSGFSSAIVSKFGKK